MAVSFIGEGNRSTLRKLPTCRKSQKNFITKCVVSSTLRHEQDSNSQLKTLVVIGTDCTGSCKSNYHMIMTMMIPLLHGHCLSVRLTCTRMEPYYHNILLKWLYHRQESELSHICVLGASILLLSTIFIFDIWMVSTVRYFVFHFKVPQKLTCGEISSWSDAFFMTCK